MFNGRVSLVGRETQGNNTWIWGEMPEFNSHRMLTDWLAHISDFQCGGALAAPKAGHGHFLLKLESGIGNEAEGKVG